MSAKGRPLLTLPFTNGAVAALARQRLVKLSAAASVAYAASASDPPIGVTDRPSPVGDPVDVIVAGQVPVELGAAVALGQQVVAGADGKAHPAPARSHYQKLVAGAAANTDIAVAGILTTDALVGAVELAGAAYTDVLANTTIHSDGNIRVSTATAGNKVLVTWHRPVHIAGRALAAGVAGDIGMILLAPTTL